MTEKLGITVEMFNSKKVTEKMRMATLVNYLMDNPDRVYTQEDLESIHQFPCVGLLLDRLSGEVLPINSSYLFKHKEQEYDWQDKCEREKYFTINEKWLELMARWQEWKEEWDTLTNFQKAWRGNTEPVIVNTWIIEYLEVMGGIE